MKLNQLLALIALSFCSISSFSQLNGIYTVGPAGNYTNLQAAITDVRTLGMSGSVTFNLDPILLDTLPIVFPTFINGLSATQTLLIQTRIQSNPSRAILENRSAPNQTNYVINCSLPHVTFRNLEILADTGYRTINGTISIDNGIVEDCKIVCRNNPPGIEIGSNAQLLASEIHASYATAVLIKAGSSNVLIRDNSVKSYRTSGLYSNQGRHHKIEHNTFTGQKLQSSAIVINNGDSIQIKRNTITEFADPRSYFTYYSQGIQLRYSNNSLVQNNMVSSEGIAFNQLAGMGNTVQHNSFRNPYKGAARATVSFEIYGANDTLNKFVNNVISNENNELLSMESVNVSNSFKEFDYNNWYSSAASTSIRYAVGSSINYYGLTNWKNASSLDKNSISIYPGFNSSYNLHSQAIGLRGKGQFDPSVTVDIDGNPRTANPSTLGADEFQPTTNNVQMELVKLADNCGGTGSVSVKIVNQGSNTLNSCSIGWSLSNENAVNIAQPAYQNTVSLPSGSSAIVHLGSYAIVRGDTTNVLAFVHNPNNSVDPITIGDTAQTKKINRNFTGEYTLGGANPDFDSVTHFINRLRYRGACKAVILNVVSGNYNDNVHFKGYDSWATDTNQLITIKSAPGNPTRPVFSYNRKVKGFAVWEIDDFPNLVLDSLEFEQSALLEDPYLLYIKNCRNVLVQNCKFSGKDVHTTGRGSTNVICTGTDSVKFIKNKFYQGFYSLTVSKSNGALIKENFFTTYSKSGFGLGSSNGATITQNHFKPFSPEVIEASFTMGTCSSFVVSKNYFETDNSKMTITRDAIEIRNCPSDATNPSYITNNDIRAWSTGIDLSTSSHVYIEHNSIRAYNSTALYISAGGRHRDEDIVIRNNLLQSPGVALYIRTNNNSNYISDVNYNNYYADSNKSFLQYNSVYFDSLSVWQAHKGFDKNSKNEYPRYVAATLIPKNIELDNLGTPLNHITKDFNGLVRSTSTPDIGAYEFTGTQSFVNIEQPIDIKQKVVLYPNPTYDVLHMKWQIEDQVSISITDNVGRAVLIHTTEEHNTDTEISIGHLPNGVYTLQVVGAKTQSSSVLVKQ